MQIKERKLEMVRFCDRLTTCKLYRGKKRKERRKETDDERGKVDKESMKGRK